MKKYNFTALLLIFTCVSCQPKSPLFSGENAFQHLIKQCSFGPRNPGSEGHKNTLNYYLNTFKGLADTVFTQSFEDEMPRTRAKVKMNNVIAQFNRESNKQIMISAHWDTRPWADTGSIMKKEMPILGANDGASGVAVIIELAYIFKQNPPPIGVSLVLFDAEEFYIERISYQQNASLVLELWELSEELGLKAFKKQAKDSIFDDHVPLYEIAGIPAINIIDFDYPNDKTNYWHTHNDIVQNCSPNGLYQVGTLLVNHIYNKK